MLPKTTLKTNLRGFYSYFIFLLPLFCKFMEPNRRVTFKIDPEVRDFDVRESDVRDSEVRDYNFGHSFISPNNHERADYCISIAAIRAAFIHAKLQRSVACKIQ